jgi:hypothetical protein
MPAHPQVVGNWTLTSAGQLEGLFADLVASGQVTAGAQVAVPTPAGEDPTWMDGTYIDPRDDAVNLIPSYRQVGCLKSAGAAQCF